MPGIQDLFTLPPVSHSGDLAADTSAFLTARGKPHTAAHCRAVAETSRALASRFGLNEETAATAALLHDISAVLPARDMLRYAQACGWVIDPAEAAHPFLLHQRVSADMAGQLFGVVDPAVLSAIACHTTLKAQASGQDMLLFLADKLAWDQEGVPPFYDAVFSALEDGLAQACLVYIRYVFDHGMILFPHRWLIEAKEWIEITAPGNPAGG
ncbi:MAG: bis(5'-nucleosyl)-tetraphosphatase (symmetrical) YqeK [Oscillospiraceae bacterium]|jgi:predicted HD superfamily hydrolase involved in NAD metabolism|nr:bis(5'-nucleosyl)-tetraphosphatase (symmetrical) YqeK [Oscillospiraceae bacterium]